MEGILCVFSSLLIIEGTILAVYSDRCRELMQDLFNGLFDKLLALIAFMIGLALLIAAFYARCPVFFIVIAAIVILKSLLYLLDPKQYFSKLANWFVSVASDRLYRFLGVLEVMLGTVSFFFV
jgi:hypothetical protein